jgi:hypothetical protein
VQSKYSISSKPWHKELFPEPGTPVSQRTDLLAHADSKSPAQKDLLTIFIGYHK